MLWFIFHILYKYIMVFLGVARMGLRQRRGDSEWEKLGIRLKRGALSGNSREWACTKGDVSLRRELRSCEALIQAAFRP